MSVLPYATALTYLDLVVEVRLDPAVDREDVVFVWDPVHYSDGVHVPTVRDTPRVSPYLREECIDNVIH